MTGLHLVGEYLLLFGLKNLALGGSGWDSLITQVTFRFGTCHGRCSRVITRGLEMCVLDGVNTCSLPGSGCESFCRGQCHWIRAWGLTTGSIPESVHWLLEI